jgi:hypothetical protein
MTAKIVPIARGRRCSVCGGLSAPINRFGLVTDAEGKDAFVHLGCAETWQAWQQTACHHCGIGDRPGDPIGIHLDGRGGDVALHAGCWSRWRAGQEQASEIDSNVDETDCLFCGGGPDGGGLFKVFSGSITADGWIHLRCRDGYIELCGEDYVP